MDVVKLNLNSNETLIKKKSDMETLSVSAINSLPLTHCKTQSRTSSLTTLKFSSPQIKKNYSISLPASRTIVATASPTATTTPFTSDSLSPADAGNNTHWMVLMERPQDGFDTKPEIVNYYVKTLEKVLGSERDAQICIYDVSVDTHLGFCCDIDEETSRQLACLPEVWLVKPDSDHGSSEKDYSFSKLQVNDVSTTHIGGNALFAARSTEHWLVRMDKPRVGVVTKAQMVDYYARILAKVLGNEKDAQMCIYHVSWQSNFGFCCELDEECARELASVPGVLSVHPDETFGSENKDYGGDNLQNPIVSPSSSEADEVTPIKTKKLFVTGLSFYTSEKTLRAAFEGFGELVEVKIIMDKISKRSKGYAFVEYATEEAASAALKEMNGKIINGWMIVVDVAKSTPPRLSRRNPPRPF